MSDDITDKVLYRVKKVTFGRKQCRVCGGSGKRNNKSGSDEKCLNCIKGVETVEHMTEISLRTALIEIGIENLIRRTVAETFPKLCNQDKNIGKVEQTNNTENKQL